MSIRIDVWSDFVCPFCYAAALGLEALRETHDIAVHWRSFELRPAGTGVSPAYAERVQASRPRVAQWLWEEFGVEVRFGPFGINSHKALVGAKYAEAQGAATGEAYRRAALQAYWLEGRSIDDLGVLKDIAAQAGMEGESFAAALAMPQYEGQVQADVALASRLGLNGVPALLFERKYLVSGAQPVETLREIVEEVQKLNADPSP